ncbi:MAG: hypothetical protein V1781_04570 [Bacteroidota bacterium]
MATTSETGHAKNVANFEIEISICSGFGTAYNPSKSNHKIPQLQTLLTTSKNVLQTVKTTGTTFENTRNAREIAFSPAPLKKFCTRIVNALEATDATKQTVNNAKVINRKIQGKRADTSIKTTLATINNSEKSATAEINQISVSQQSYDNLLDNFAKLIVCVAAEPLYIPNETDLKVIGLNTTITNFRTLNTAVINAAVPYQSAMIARDAVLYQDNTGLVDIAMEVKKYVKSVFGSTSPQYKQVSKLEFKKIKR